MLQRALQFCVALIAESVAVEEEFLPLGGEVIGEEFLH